MTIEKASKIGFCFGVRRAIDIVEKAARGRGGVETLRAIVHNEPVLRKLATMGVRVARDIGDIQGKVVAISAHGVSPEVEEDIRQRNIEIIDTTCPFVHRAQVVARRLNESGFFVVVYGDANHPEVKGVLGWAKNRGMATIDSNFVASLNTLPRHVGVLSQTTQVPADFNHFVKEVIDFALTKDSELRIIDTICYEIRERQVAALELANRVDLMLVVGGHNSANSNHLAELCSTITPTHLVETASEIQKSWFGGRSQIGITAGASTGDETIEEVVNYLESVT
ncbi:4-hydroxy-3-methylbut-2-enyl diphosphate reductase [Chloroflexota bacterium]